MSSILTNSGAMVALQTMRGINKDMAQTQNEIATGKKVATAQDNASTWAISKVMESDVAGFKAISDSLALGKATVGVASAAAEQIVSELNDIKQLIISAQSENVDHAKIQNDIEERTAQITAIIGAAQFNGANLLAEKVDGGEADSVSILSSLDRVGTTDPKASYIEIETVDFETKLDFTDEDILTKITDTETAGTALGNIEKLIDAAITGAAALGASAARLDSQSQFVTKLSDAMNAGIGALVDADMEAASARLQALQVQQQLATQSLSIANQQPQNILALFR